MKKTIIITATTLIFYFLHAFGGTYAQVAGTPYIIPTYYEEETGFCPLGLTTEGTDFWVTFGNNNYRPVTGVYLEIKIATKTDTDVTLTFTETGDQAIYHITGGMVYPIDLSNVSGNIAGSLGDMRAAVYVSDASAPAVTGTYNRSLHIETSSPTSVYAFNTGFTTTDATLVMPTTSWGTDYYRLSRAPISNQNDQELIIAKEDDTELFLNGATTPFATIDTGEIYNTRGNLGADVTGRHVTSNKPVAYFTHVTIANIPVAPAADILFEQLVPVAQWGKNFLIPAAPAGISINNQNRVRIIASENDTTITWDTSAATVVASGGGTGFSGPLNAGQWRELLLSSPSVPIPNDAGACYIQTDKPIGVVAYMPSGGESNEINGDPSIAVVPSLEQLVPEALIAPFIFDPNVPNSNTVFDVQDAVHYMMLIAPTETADQTVVTMDSGATIIDITNGGTNPWIENPASSTIGSTKYSYIRYQFDNVAHYGKSFDIKNPRGVIVFAAGAANYESYYYNAGSGACTINP
jgi:hypothetical protein